MKNKKIKGVLLFVTISLQLFVIVGLLFYTNVIEKRGLENAPVYKIKIHDLSYDNYGVPYIDFVFDELGGYEGEYAKLSTDDNEIAKFEFMNDKPQSGDYIKSEPGAWYFRVDLYKYNSFLNEIQTFDNLESVLFTSESGQFSINEGVEGGCIAVGTDELILEAKIYKGSVIAQNITVDGENIYDVLSFYNDNFDELYQKQIS